MHFIGHTQFYDVYTKLVHNSGFEMVTFGPAGRQVGRLTTIHPETGERAVQTFKGVREFWTFSVVMGMFRDMSGVTWTEERRPIKGITCPDCEGRGVIEDMEGNWAPCQRCGEDGVI
jgi:hypothetical protein